MNKLVLALLMVLFSLFANAQCEYGKNETDEFTGEKIIQTKVKRISKRGYSGGLSMIAYLKNNKIYVELAYANQSVFSIKKGQKIYLLFSDGSKITEEKLSTDVANLVGSEFIVTFVLILSEEQINTLLTKQVSKVRVETSKGNFDLEIRAKSKTEISKDINCIKIHLKEE